MAAPAAVSKPIYDAVLAALRQQYRSEKIFDGIFGAEMLVDLQNDGPVTIWLDSNARLPGLLLLLLATSLLYFSLCNWNRHEYGH